MLALVRGSRGGSAGKRGRGGGLGGDWGGLVRGWGGGRGPTLLTSHSAPPPGHPNSLEKLLEAMSKRNRAQTTKWNPLPSNTRSGEQNWWNSSGTLCCPPIRKIYMSHIQLIQHHVFGGKPAGCPHQSLMKLDTARLALYE